MVVVDVDHERGTAHEVEVVADPILVGAVDRDEHALGGVLREGSREPLELHELVLRWDRGVAVEVHDRVLAQLLEQQRGREQRAERVTVGVLVRRDEKAVVFAERRGDRAKITRRRLGRAHR